MRKAIALIFCCALILVSGEETKNIKIDEFHSSTTASSTSSKPTTTILETSTSSSTTTTTTTESTTTSTTTTPIPTTTSSSTTTPTPTTTNAPIPTTTNAPIPTTPVPDPTMKKWMINGTDGTQIIAQMAIQLIITYNSTSKQNVSKATLDVPTDSALDGTFNGNDESMKLSWKSGGSINNSLTLYFKQDNKTYVLDSLEVSIEPESLPNMKPPTSTLKLMHKQAHFNTTLGNSYRCIKLQTFNLTKEDNAIVGEMNVSDLQFQAFKTDKKAAFGLAEDCAFDTPDIVPIAVGCILAGAVVIVLVAYLISRRRSHAQGYHSM